jgi:hypothetical protein
MDSNLVGYLLNALDADTQREVEGYLRSHPEAQQHLERLRRALEPLSADRDGVEPPAGLRPRTLARVAEHRCRERQPIPQAPSIPFRPPVRSWWRRADVLVAAAVLLVLLPLLWPALNYWHHRRNITYCQYNLHRFHTALMSYGDMHGGELPKVDKDPPRNFAGVFVPILAQEGLIQPETSVDCPAQGTRPPDRISLGQLEEEYDSQSDQYFRDAARLAGCYAYSLGYCDKDNRHCGIRRGRGFGISDDLPIMADRPPFERQEAASDPGQRDANSRNHGGAGQNVLTLGGQVWWRTNRRVGIDGDDIYVNRNNVVGAGLDPTDAVLGASEFHP